MSRSNVQVTETDTYMRSTEPGRPKTKTASHGRQLFQRSIWRRKTKPSTPDNVCQAPSPASSESPRTASRSSRLRGRAANSTRDHKAGDHRAGDHGLDVMRVCQLDLRP